MHTIQPASCHPQTTYNPIRVTKTLRPSVLSSIQQIDELDQRRSLSSKSLHPRNGIDALLRLLGYRTLLGTNIAADIRRIGGLPDDVLEGSPCLSGGWGSALVSELGIDSSSELGDGSLDEAALCIAGAEEDSVDNEQNPGSSLEEKSGTEDAEPQSDFENGNERHARIVVLLDELTD